MQYVEFKRHLGKAGLGVKEFAALTKLKPNSVWNYSITGSVPKNLALIAVLMGAMADNGIDFKNVLLKVDVEKNKARGSNHFGSS